MLYYIKHAATTEGLSGYPPLRSSFNPLSRCEFPPMKLSISTQRLQPIFLVALISVNVFFYTASPAASVHAASVPDTPRASQQKTCGHDRADPQLVTDSYGIASAPADALIDWFTSNGGTISNLVVDVGEGAKGEGECEKRRGAESDVRLCKRCVYAGP